LLRAECERLRIEAVEREGERIAIKFHSSTTIPPDRLVKVVKNSDRVRLEPSGVLRLEWPHGAGSPLVGVQNVLQELRAED
jgi:transcription-repair coupling factor (superfamily II helicase)